MSGLNPECQQGKHSNCDGRAWDDATDSLGACHCECHEPQPVRDQKAIHA